MPRAADPEFDAVVLAGGRAARMHGADKPGLAVGGTAMLVSVARAAVSAGCRRLVLVGPVRGGSVAAGLAEATAGLPGGLITVREEPPGAGPVPALRRGLAEVSAPWLALLAADLPFLTAEFLSGLLAAAAGAAGAGAAGAGAAAAGAGAVLADAGGRPQWLVSCWQVRALRAALGAYRGNSLRGLLGPLEPELVRLGVGDGPAPWLDCDTPADLSAARALAARQARAGTRRTERLNAADGEVMSTLESWVKDACAELGIEESAVDLRLVLDLARDVAHEIERPAAPVTAFVLGLAVGSGQSAAEASARLVALARAWSGKDQTG